MGLLDEIYRAGILRQPEPQGILNAPAEPQGLMGALYANPLIQRQVAAQRAAYPRTIQETPQQALDLGAGLFGMVPGVGDAMGLAADLNRYRSEPESRTIGNFGLTGLGLLPFIPGMTGMKKTTAPVPKTEDRLTIYRGEYSGNKGGKFWTPDMEFARQFTQSGQDKEILKQQIKRSEVMDFSSSVYAGDPDALEAAIKEAHKKGFKAVMVNEGSGQPNSLYWFGNNPKLPF